MVNRHQQDLFQAKEEDGLGARPSSGVTMEHQPSRTKKKVEWRNNLNAGETVAPEDRSPNWDSETGHLLSYFLDDNSSQQQEQQLNDATHVHFTTTVVSASHASSSLRGSVHSMFRNRSNGVGYDEDEPVPPPTPATHYYHPSAKPAVEAKPTSSRLKTDVNGNPVLKMKVSFAADTFGGGHSPHHQTTSPVSPTSMIGGAQEPMILPPPPQNGNNHQTHMEWLKVLNASIAAGANKTAMPQPPPQPAYNVSTTIHPTAASAVGIQSHLSHHPPTSTYPSIHTAPAPPSAAVFYPQLSPKLQQQIASSTGVESEEKRARRLQRNRESARKSRLRKKEKLKDLEEKVAEMYNAIEMERKKQIQTMDDSLALDFQKVNTDLNVDELRHQLMRIYQTAGPNCPIRRDVIDFQYSTLKETIFPRYQKFLLWLTLHSERYFLTGKETHSRQDGNKLLRTPPGKLSSKQVGEDLTNGRKQDNQTAQAFDDSRMWPLLCFELSISVDQEERYMQTQKKLEEDPDIQEKRSQMAAATRMALKLKEAMLYQSQLIEMRNKQTFIDILTPQQTLLYQKWLTSNRNRCRDVIMKRKEAFRSASPNSTANASLLDVCKRLEELVISQETNRN